jgi:hypothetical protein
VCFQYKVFNAGYYEDELVAAYARDCISKEIYGENALLNNVSQPVGWHWDNLSKRCVKSLNSEKPTQNGVVACMSINAKLKRKCLYDAAETQTKRTKAQVCV